MLVVCFPHYHFAQLTPYELNQKNYNATYHECIHFNQSLAKKYRHVKMIEWGGIDAGLPLHVVLIGKGVYKNPAQWHAAGKAVILVMNGIRPGEPDGIDASMMFTRDLTNGVIDLYDNTIVAILPVYNIGGMLNRNQYSRVDQNGPEWFGTKGNSQNLDLNRDFIKCDSKEALSFARLFQWLKPDVFIDNHVSDGADYSFTMTLATTQYQKLGGECGDYLKQIFEPSLYQKMKETGYPMIPYVNVWCKDALQDGHNFLTALATALDMLPCFIRLALQPNHIC
jgi:Zinc carboxypeptidase.